MAKNKKGQDRKDESQVGAELPEEFTAQEQTPEADAPGEVEATATTEAEADEAEGKKEYNRNTPRFLKDKAVNHCLAMAFKVAAGKLPVAALNAYVNTLCVAIVNPRQLNQELYDRMTQGLEDTPYQVSFQNGIPYVTAGQAPFGTYVPTAPATARRSTATSGTFMAAIKAVKEQSGNGSKAEEAAL